jgi:hypothetical protein
MNYKTINQHKSNKHFQILLGNTRTLSWPTASVPSFSATAKNWRPPYSTSLSDLSLWHQPCGLPNHTTFTRSISHNLGRRLGKRRTTTPIPTSDNTYTHTSATIKKEKEKRFTQFLFLQHGYKTFLIYACLCIWCGSCSKQKKTPLDKKKKLTVSNP